MRIPNPLCTRGHRVGVAGRLGAAMKLSHRKPAPLRISNDSLCRYAFVAGEGRGRAADGVHCEENQADPDEAEARRMARRERFAVDGGRKKQCDRRRDDLIRLYSPDEERPVPGEQ